MSKRLPADAYDNKPVVSVTLTRESMYLTRYENGKPAITYPVRASDVAEAFNNFGASTGLLVDDTLFWETENGQTRIGIYIPPARYTLQLADVRKSKLAVSMPGFVFVGQGKAYSLFAVTKRPTAGGDTLYQAPLPNVHTNGQICFGNVRIPTCAPDTIKKAFNLFFESEFNNHLSAGKIKRKDIELMRYLRDLHGKRIPSKMLVPGCRMADVLKGSARNDAA